MVDILKGLGGGRNLDGLTDEECATIGEVIESHYQGSNRSLMIYVIARGKEYDKRNLEGIKERMRRISCGSNKKYSP